MLSEDSNPTPDTGLVVKCEPQESLPLNPVPTPAVHSPQPDQTPDLHTPDTQLPANVPVAVKDEPVQQPPALHYPSEPVASPPAPNIPLKIASPIKTETQPLEQPQPQPDVKPDVRAPLLPRETYTTYRSVDEIEYTPEAALAEGVQMAKTIENYLKNLDLGTDLRKNIWLREVESLKRQGTPHTMIAVCGATGAGKSSLLNAVLDDNIVPTSGMRACTAVVTEIGYHDKNTIVAEVEFLALSEWKAELEILLDDLVEENGTLKRLTDLRSDAGVAWHKIHAVYPLMRAERMVTMSADEIINSNPDVARILGTTESIECRNSEDFGLAISKFIDSKDQRRGKDKQKKTSRDKSKMDGVALWPLIRLVRVRAKSKALSSGAVLVDLPGVADANLARSSIAKDYMKKCNCIWVAAPITRAVDDKTAKDLLGEAFRTQLMNGNYDASVITFIATKTDDISCTEVIGALGLEEHPELVEIESELDAALLEVEEWSATGKSAAEEIKETTNEIKRLRPILDEYKDHLKALKSGKPFKPVLTAPKKAESPESKKRKRGPGGRKAKRARLDGDNDASSDLEDDSNFENDDDFISDEDDEEDAEGETDSEDAMVEDALNLGSVIEIESDSDEVIVLSDSDDPDTSKADVGTPSVTQESLEQHIKNTEAKLKELRAKLQEQKKTRADAEAKANVHKKEASKLQQKKNAFCAMRRNEYSKDVLKEDFRQGLKQLDQADEEAKNPETFDPTRDLRDYNAIDLPVFTCSSRDYIRIKKQVKRDGGPTCFTNPDETEIPALQEWCHQLTTSARERSARSLLKNLITFLNSMKSFVDKMEGVKDSDRAVLANLWESNARVVEPGYTLGLTQAQPNPPPAPVLPPMPLYGRQARYRAIPPPPDNSLNGMAERAQRVLEREREALQPDDKGVSFLLRQNMKKIAADCVENLKRAFRDGIAERCHSGATKAKLAAVQTSDNFAASMHWQSYRAALRRYGEWRGDLNADLIGPMAREIAASWARLFDSDLFASTLQAERAEITRLLQEIEASAPPELKARCHAQSQLALREAQVLTANIIQNIKTVLTDEQKNISRCLTPHVQKELSAAYIAALEERGTGSVARQKLLFHNYVDRWRDKIFSSGTTILFDKLDRAAEMIGILLEAAFSELADKIEVNVSVLWDMPKHNREQVMKRRELIGNIHAMVRQLELWVAASRIASNGGIGMEPEHETEDDEAANANGGLERGYGLLDSTMGAGVEGGDITDADATDEDDMGENNTDEDEDDMDEYGMWGYRMRGYGIDEDSMDEDGTDCDSADGDGTDNDATNCGF